MVARGYVLPRGDLAARIHGIRKTKAPTLQVRALRFGLNMALNPYSDPQTGKVKLHLVHVPPF